jgi:hypothetical protein
VLTGRTLAAALVVLLLTALLARWPLLSASDPLLDGDEAVQGLMSLHVSQGQGHPLFFYGQRYGLCILETELAAQAFNLLGVGPIPLRLAMGLLWLVGASVLVAAAGRWGGARAAVLAAFLIPTLPAWIPWSLKARGGYASAFLFMSLFTWLALSPSPRTRGAESRRAVGLGAFAALILLAQPVFFLVPLAFGAEAAVTRRLRRSSVVLCLTAAAVVALPLAWLGLRHATGDHFPSLSNSPSLLRGLLDLPAMALDSVVGAFYMRDALRTPWTTAAGVAWGGALLVTAAASSLRCLRERSGGVGLAPTALLVGTLIVCVPSNTPRYVLPLLALAAPWIAVELARLRTPLASFAPALLLASLGLALTPLYPRLTYPGTVIDRAAEERASFDAMIAHLQASDVHAVFSLHHLLEWQVAFETREAIVARWTKARDRIPAYIRRVDEAWAAGEPTAVVAHAWQREELEASLSEGEHIEDMGLHLLVANPSGPTLEKLGFRSIPAVSR